MVSLRRKKHTVVTEGGQRRSARLLALEEQKNEKSVHAITTVDILEAPNDAQTRKRKRGRKKETYEDFDYPSRYCGDSSNSPSAIQRQTDCIIEYILDMLELKDTKELFSMPDEFQTTDFSERVSKPGDLATLRQKHRDGMYLTLEQFESDVYTVFNKAITLNTEDSIPAREATSLLEHSKQVFQSLRNNRTYSVLELSTWHQKYFPSKTRSTRHCQNISNLASATNASTKGRKPTSNCNQGLIIFPQSKAASRSHNRKGDFADCSKLIAEQRRDTYKPGSHSNKAAMVSMAFEQPKLLAYCNKNAPSYKESLLLYVSSAGPQAKMAAHAKCMDFNTQFLMSSFSRQHFPHLEENLAQTSKFFGNTLMPSSGTSGGGITSSSALDSSPDDIEQVQKGPTCELETDELLRLFCQIGTPTFLESCNEISSSSSKQAINDNQSFSLPSNHGGLAQGSSAAAIRSKCTSSSCDLASWPTRLGGSHPLRSLRMAEPEVGAGPDRGESSAGNLGFDRFAKSGEPFKLGSLNLFCRGGKN